MTNDPTSSRIVDVIGKLVGLAMSVTFLVLAIWFVLSGEFESSTDSTLRGFYLMAILLGGPIPYFFVGTTTKFNVRTPVGKGTVVGGYAFAIIAVLIVHSLPASYVWRMVKFDNALHGIQPDYIRVVDQSSGAEVFEVRTYSAEAPATRIEPYRLICRFDANTPLATIHLTVPDSVRGFTQIATQVDRVGAPMDVALNLTRETD